MKIRRLSTNLDMKSVFRIKILLATFSVTNQLYVKHFLVQFEWLGAKIIAFS